MNTKVVMRRLPPDMTAKTFCEQVSPLPPHNYLYFVAADGSLGRHAFGRAYVNFLHVQDLLHFKGKYDGYVFLSAKGAEYPAVVEFAPFQRLSRERGFKKRDAQQDTLDKHSAYKLFESGIANAPRKPPESVHLDPKFEKRAEDTVTPLLRYVAQKRAERGLDKDKKYKRNYREGATCVFFNRRRKF